MADNQASDSNANAGGMAETVRQPQSQQNGDESNANDGMDNATVNGQDDAEAAAKEAAEAADAKKLTSLLDWRLREDHASFSRLVMASKLSDEASAMSEKAVTESLQKEFKVLVKDFRMPVSGIGVLQAGVFLAPLECFPDGE